MTNDTVLNLLASQLITMLERTYGLEGKEALWVLYKSVNFETLIKELDGDSNSSGNTWHIQKAVIEYNRIKNALDSIILQSLFPD